LHKDVEHSKHTNFFFITYKADLFLLHSHTCTRSWLY